MKTKKITFEKTQLEKFLAETSLVLKANSLQRVAGGATYRNYAESTYVNRLGGISGNV